VTPAAEVTVVVVTWQAGHLLAACLDSVLASDCPHRLLVVDNASTDSTADLLGTRYPDVPVARQPRNLGFAGGAAAGLDLVRTPYAVLLNDDAVASPGWLAALVAALDAYPRAGAVASKVLLEDGRINSAGGLVTRDGYGVDRGYGEPDDGRWDLPGEVFVAPGTACALRMTAVREVGGMAAPYFLYYEDTDLCWRLWLAGWSVRYEPAAVVRHRHAASAGVGSPVHRFYDARNRLLTLTRCAPAGLALGQVARYPLTTLSWAGAAVRARGPERARLLGVARSRVAAGASYAGMLPWALRTRRAAPRTCSRRQVAARLSPPAD